MNNRVFISNDTSGDVTFINGATNTVIKTVATGLNPSIHTLDNTANLLIVGNYNSGTISAFELDTLASLGTVTTGVNPWTSFIDVGVRAIHVTNRGSNTVSIIDMHDGVVKQTIPVGTAPQNVARHFQNFYVVNQNNGGAGSVSVYKRPDFRHSWDLGDNGRADLVWHNSSTKQIAGWLMDGTTPTSSAVLLGTSDWLPVVRADLDGDGKSDIVFRNTVTQQTAAWFMDNLAARPGMAGVILGSNNFAPFTATGCAGVTARCLLWRDPVSGAVAYWFMNTGLAPTYTQIVFPGPAAWGEPITANFNGDFHADLLWQHTDGTVAIWLMQGDQTAGFSAKQTGFILGPGTGWVPEFVGDFDGDGRSDILWRHASTGDTAIWLMNGLAQKAGGTAIILPGSLGWTVTHVRDLDGDNKSDLIWRHTSGATAAWLMDGIATKSGAVLLGDPNWSVTHTLDTNNDLKGDLLWRNSATGQTALWQMNGLTSTATSILSGDPNWVVVPPSD